MELRSLVGRTRRRAETISDCDGADYGGADEPDRGASNGQSEVDKPFGVPGLLVTGALLLVHGLLSVGLMISAFFGQIQFEGCGYIGSTRQCNYALGTGALYGLVAVVILLFAAAISLVVRARGSAKPGWPIPIVGSAASLLAFVVYVQVMDMATH